ncbi:MAG: deoxyribonuclease IV, partial [Spirochaetota bacterium]
GILVTASLLVNLGLTMLNLHPGAHPGETGPDAAFTRIAEAVDEVLNETESIVLVLENTAGMGNSAGYRFEHLSEIILRARGKDRIGVCIDTCHLFAAGYDIRTPEAFRSTFKRFDEMIGFRKLRAMHLNDSRVPLGSRRDRHANLGAGMLGLAPFQMIMQDKRFNDIPLVLETSDRTLWPEEILMLRNFERSDLRSHFTLKLRSFCGTTVKMLQNFEKYLLD